MTRSTSPQVEIDLIREIEHERLHALLEANMEVARQLHADDFQLINPGGQSFSKEQYLSAISSGDLDYLVWEPGPTEVRLYDQAAIIRYQAQLECLFHGRKVPRERYWHTDLYEKRNGRWQVVWSQATRIMRP